MTLFKGDLIELDEDGKNTQVEIELNPETLEFVFNLANQTIVTEKIKVTPDTVRYIDSYIHSNKIMYSFVILSSYRAELTLFDALNGHTTLYRMMREFDFQMPLGFIQYLQYFAQKILFHLI